MKFVSDDYLENSVTVEDITSISAKVVVNSTGYLIDFKGTDLFNNKYKNIHIERRSINIIILTSACIKKVSSHFSFVLYDTVCFF